MSISRFCANVTRVRAHTHACTGGVREVAADCIRVVIRYVALSLSSLALSLFLSLSLSPSLSPSSLSLLSLSSPSLSLSFSLPQTGGPRLLVHRGRGLCPTRPALQLRLVRNRGARHGERFSKVMYIVALHSTYTRALTFEKINFRRASRR
jgi:hypothetical protein